MSDLKVRVRSNLDALSARVLHDAFKSLVRNAVHEMHTVAQAAAPKRTGLLAEHIKEEEIGEVVDMVVGRVGVTAVREADERPSYGRYRRSQYPLFVHGGTRSEIFPARATTMWNPAEGIFARKSVRGQSPQPFMAAAHAAAKTIIEEDPSVEIALKEMAARAIAERAEIEAT